MIRTAVELTSDLDFWRRQVVRVAEGNLGYGETEGNNRGPFLRAIGAPDGANWCAYFAWYTHRRGAEYAEIALPYQGSGAAKRLARRIRDCPRGFLTTDPALVLPGDLVILSREGAPRTLDDGPGHVRVAVDFVRPDDRLPQIEGNSGRFPAKVRRRATNPLAEHGFVAFVGLR